MKENKKAFISGLLIAWAVVSPIWVMISYTYGWNKGFTACSAVWTEQIDSYITRLRSRK